MFHHEHQVADGLLKLVDAVIKFFEFLFVGFLFVLDVECCDEVDYVFFVLDGVYPPVFDDKLQLKYRFVRSFFLVVGVEAVSHDGDQHIQHVDTHEEAESEKEEQEWVLHLVPEVATNVEFPQRRQVYVHDSANKARVLGWLIRQTRHCV